MNLLEKAKDKIMMGAERRSMIITDKEKEITAYHEAGHALVAWLLPGTDPIHKVTIIPRGRALGLTMQLPIDEKYTHSKSFLENSICILFGGRIAEKLIFDEITTGAGNDLERATSLARKMVCEWGMSDALGPLTYGKKEEQIFLGREIAQHRDFSEETARQIDLAVKQIINNAVKKVTELLESNKDILDRMTEELLEKETIVLEDIDRILQELRPGQYQSRNQARKDALTPKTTGVAEDAVFQVEEEVTVPPQKAEPEVSGSEAKTGSISESGATGG
jgi:cell division protease FtsH